MECQSEKKILVCVATLAEARDRVELVLVKTAWQEEGQLDNTSWIINFCEFKLNSNWGRMKFNDRSGTVHFPILNG